MQKHENKKNMDENKKTEPSQKRNRKGKNKKNIHHKGLKVLEGK
jgi:hypothetical protein